jgi:hypothetical protein
MAQSYVGKSAISKGIGRAIRKFVVFGLRFQRRRLGRSMPRDEPWRLPRRACGEGSLATPRNSKFDREALPNCAFCV